MKRVGACVCIVFCMMAVNCFPVCAAHALDGIIARNEYKDQSIQLISHRYESNNDVSLAFLYADISAPDYSVYVGVKYVCDDIDILLDKKAEDTEEPRTGNTSGIEISIQDVVCLTAYENGTFSEWDTNRYDAEGVFTLFSDGTHKPDTNTFLAEIRLGLKYWIPYNAVLGIRILDCSGTPSNYYTFVINPPPTTTSTTLAPSTTAKQTCTSVLETDAHKTETETAARITRRIITAASADLRKTTALPEKAEEKGTVEPSATTKPPVSRTAAAVRHAKAKAEKQTAKATETKSKTTQTQTVSCSAAETETTADVTGSTVSASPPPYTAAKALRLNRMRTIGIAVATALITAAVMISVFVGVRAQAAGKEALSTGQPSPPDDPPDDDPGDARDTPDDDF